MFSRLVIVGFHLREEEDGADLGLWVRVAPQFNSPAEKFTLLINQ